MRAARLECCQKHVQVNGADVHLDNAEFTFNSKQVSFSILFTTATHHCLKMSSNTSGLGL